MNLAKPVSGFVPQFIRYCLTGGLAFIIDFALLYFFTDVLSCHYWIGTTVGYLVGLSVTYILSVLWVFDEHRTKKKWLEASGFLVIGVIGIALTNLFMWLFSEFIFGVGNYRISKVVTTVIVSVLNFILKKYILFSKR